MQSLVENQQQAVYENLKTPSIKKILIPCWNFLTRL